MSDIENLLDSVALQPTITREQCPIHGGTGGLLGCCDCGGAETDTELAQRIANGRAAPETTGTRLRRVLGAEIARLRDLLFAGSVCEGARWTADIASCNVCHLHDDDGRCRVDGWEPPTDA